MSIFKYKIAIASICIISIAESCKKLIEVDPPINQLEQKLVFSDPTLATASVTGLYSKMVTTQTQFGSFLLSVYPGLSADELFNNGTNSNYEQFYTNSISISSSIIRDGFYSHAYKYIYHTNACLEGLSGSSNIPTDILAQLTGEMKFMRAFYYFYLVNLFGDVPLVTQTDFELNTSIPRAPAADIYKQIVRDLDEAINVLQPAYPTVGKVRPNKWAATTLLSRAYLYLGNWTKAEELATAVISSNAYSLVTNLDSVFLNNNREAIWQLQMSLPTFVQEAQIFIPTTATGKPALTFTLQLLNSFDAGDKRRTSWVKTSTASGGPYYYPFKYKTRSSSTVTANATEQITFLRLAEPYLIRAEARAQQNNLQGSISDINTIRQRAGLTPLANSLSQASVLNAVAAERRIEFMAELGHRWFDLKRTGKANNVLPAVKANWQPTDTLYPIPNAERLLNPKLTQNPGY